MAETSCAFGKQKGMHLGLFAHGAEVGRTDWHIPPLISIDSCLVPEYR